MQLDPKTRLAFSPRELRAGCSMRRAIALAAALLGGLVSSIGRGEATGHADRPEQGTFIEDKVRALYSDVAHIGPAALSRLIEAAPEAVLLIDVRSEDEFKVSRLAKARRLEPKAEARDALLQIGDVRGKSIVLYCAIGLRSSRQATKLQAKLKAKGAIAVYNLGGGLFRWQGEERPLVNADGETRFVHPYSRLWRRFMDRPDLARETP